MGGSSSFLMIPTESFFLSDLNHPKLTFRISMFNAVEKGLLVLGMKHIRFSIKQDVHVLDQCTSIGNGLTSSEMSELPVGR